ncbi:MAG: acyl-CoA thioesterase [Alphaproteobacteria bacterium]|nr:acyl-CoA thioesterase [Alphaproteobacteria bacterium]
MIMYNHKVQYYETDKMGIVHHSNYIRWMEEARTDYLSSIGWGYDVFEKQGIISPVVSVKAEYKNTSTFGDTISIEIKIEKFNGIRMEVSYIMKKNNDQIVFIGYSEHCFLNADGRLVNAKKTYPDFYSKIQELMTA